MIVFAVCPQIRKRHKGNVIVNFLSQVSFFSFVFLGMVMCANEAESLEAKEI